MRERSTLAADCTEADFRTLETALYQVTTENGSTGAGSVRICSYFIVRRYDQRNTSDRSSANAALISNIIERDHAKDKEQFDDVLRNLINETNKYEGWFGEVLDEEKSLAVKRLMPENLLKSRFRGTTLPSLPYEELLIALENIIIDKVTTHSVSQVKKIDTSAPMDVGMAAGTECEEAFEEGYGKTSELAVQTVYKGAGPKCGWNGGEGPSWSVQKYFNSGMGEKGANRAGKGQWFKTGGKKGGKGQEKGGTGDSHGKTGHIAANCVKGLVQESDRCGRRQRRHQ